MTSNRIENAQAEITYGSGDVFADLGIELAPDDRVKIALARRISNAIAERALTQSEAASVIGVDQAKVSAITRGRIDGFSIERLMKILAALGWDITIELSPSPSERGQMRVHSQGENENKPLLPA